MKIVLIALFVITNYYLIKAQNLDTLERIVIVEDTIFSYSRITKENYESNVVLGIEELIDRIDLINKIKLEDRFSEITSKKKYFTTDH